LDELGIAAKPAATAAPAAAPPAGAADILAALEHQPATRDELGARVGRSPEQLALELLELELAGRVALDRDGRWRPQPPRR
jgi:predicted Rossmann fold nucleotide-binding protein DprA/Smf involved in DNA uptake